MPQDHPEPDSDAIPLWRPTTTDTESARTALIELRNRLDRELETASCNVFLFAKRGRRLEDHYRRLAMTGNLAADFKTEFDSVLRRLIMAAVGQPDGLRPHAFGEHVEGTVAFLPLGSMGRFGENIAHVPTDGTWERIFEPSETAFTDSLKTIFVSIAFTNPRERLLIGQAYSPARVLKKGISAHLI